MVLLRVILVVPKLRVILVVRSSEEMVTEEIVMLRLHLNVLIVLIKSRIIYAIRGYLNFNSRMIMQFWGFSNPNRG